MQRRMESGAQSHPRSIPGMFASSKMAVTMRYASSYERRFLEWCEQSQNVVCFASYGLHKIRIPYTCPDRLIAAWYYPDFLIELRDGSTWLCEVKPASLVTASRVVAKALAALAACNDLGHSYCFVTEATLETLESGASDCPVAFSDSSP